MKRFHRFLTLALALMMVMSMLSIGAMADEIPVLKVFQDAFGSRNDYFDDMDARVDSYLGNQYTDLTVSHSIKASDYQNYIDYGNTYWEIVGIGSTSTHEHINNGVMEMDVPPFPYLGTADDQKAWIDLYGDITVAYALHQHDLSGAPWHYDKFYHWKDCTQCGHRVFLEWHSDKNNDGVCDFCGNEIFYYNITLKDTPGGKVTLSANKGAMNDRINVTVTPDAGYHLGEIHFYNKNEQHSELTRWERKVEPGYYFIILNWDIEVEATFVKD